MSFLIPALKTDGEYIIFPLRNTITHSRAFSGRYFIFAHWEREFVQIEQGAGLGTEISTE